MTWRELIKPVISSWPANQQERAIHEVREDNDEAEQLGFQCELDYHAGYNNFRYVKGPIVVFNTADGWCRAMRYAGRAERAFYAHRYYHSLSQALRDQQPRAFRDEFGVLQTA